MEDSKSGYTLDEKRKRQSAYEYLCRLEEAKKWLEYVLKKELPDSCDLETHLRNGIDLAVLATIVAPEACTRNRVYDIDFKRFEQRGLHFKHTDNTVMFIKGLKAIGLPAIFLPETLDLYDAKNTPRVIFCIHALSHYLAKKGQYPLIENLYGQAEFGEQQLNKVQMALEKHGVRLPAFSKIGGMLAGELSEDDAAIHAAIVLISEALDTEDLNVFLERLKAPILHLIRVRDANVQGYFNSMKTRKDKKIEAANKKLEETKGELDVYDKILNQTEIQDCIHVYNIEVILEKINAALVKENVDELKQCFISPDLGDIGSKEENSEKYASFALQFHKTSHETISQLKLDDVKSIISAVNHESEQTKIAVTFINQVQNLLKNRDIEGLLNLIINAPSEFKLIHSNRSNLIFNSLNEVFKLRGSFERDTLASTLQILDIVCSINKAIESNDSVELYNLLKRSELCIDGVDPDSSSRYLQTMVSLKAKKAAELGEENSELLLDDITSCVEEVNQIVQEEFGKFEIVTQINNVLTTMSADELIQCLLDTRSKFRNVRSKNKDTYLQALIHLKEEHKKSEDTFSLAYEVIQNVIDTYNTHVDNAELLIGIVEKLNKALLSDTDNVVMSLLKQLQISGLIDECEASYISSLKTAVKSRSLDSWNGWTKHIITSSDSKSVYYHHKNNNYAWYKTPEDYTENTGYLNFVTIQDVCSRVGSDYNRELYFKNNIDLIIIIQKYYQTYKIQSAYNQHMNFINKELPSLMCLQSFARSYRSRRYYLQCVNQCLSNQEDGGWIKSYLSSALKRERYMTKLKYYQGFNQSILAIQAIIRGYITKNDYTNLIHMTKPSLKQLYKYLNLLELDAADVLEEKELVRLRNQVFNQIKEVGMLEDHIKRMDLTIGLLVKNRINIQEAEARNARYKKGSREEETETFTKEKLELRERFGKIFYVLQHVPIYISKLFLFLSVQKTPQFVRDLFYNIFNLGTTKFDEYYILKVFEVMLQEDIKENVQSLQEFIKQDSLVIRLSVPLFRDLRAPTFNKIILYEPITQIMQHKESLTVSPIEVYRKWLNDMEVATGKTSDLPYEVSALEALAHEEVRTTLHKNLQSLLSYATFMRDSVINNRDFIPYGIRYTAKIIYKYLRQRFEATVPVEEINKIVATVLYYRFVNPPTVTPDKFNVFPDNVDISAAQRKNLGSVSSILQKSAAGQFYEFLDPILQPLYDFMEETYHKFIAFFLAVSDVQTLEEYYNINEFSDRTLLTKPTVKLSVKDVLFVHSMLLEAFELVFPSEEDSFFVFLKETGINIKPSDLVDHLPKQQPQQQTKKKADKNAPVVPEIDEEALATTQIVLQITPPDLLLDTEEHRNKEMAAQTINYLVDILHFCHRDTVKDVLSSTFSAEDEKKYRELLIERERLSSQAGEVTDEQNGEDQSKAVVSDQSSKYRTLAQTLEALNANLLKLQEAEIFSTDNDYQDLLMSVVKKVVERTQYVKSRKMDICRYRSTIDDLKSKITSLVSQQEAYDNYIKGCVSQMGAVSKKKTKKISVKKSAAKLHQRKIIVEIEGVPVEAYRTINVEFSTTDDPGVFLIEGTVFGSKHLSYKLVFADLLQHKFNDTSIIKILDIVKVRVNLLINFMNTHFHN